MKRTHSAFARAFIHTSLGSVIVVALLLVEKMDVVVALVLLTVCFLCLELVRFISPTFGQWISAHLALFMRAEEDTRPMGASYFLIGSVVTAAAFPRDVAVVAMLFLSFGDPIATLVGRWRGRVKVWSKTLEGSLSCLAICLLAGTLSASFWESPQLGVVVVGAFFASICEMLPLHVNDNITIPIGAGASMLAAQWVLRTWIGS